MKLEKTKQTNLRIKFLIVSTVVFAGILAIGALGWFNLSGVAKLAKRSQADEQLLTECVDTARSGQVSFKKQVQEWKDILLRGNDPQELVKHKQVFDEEEHATQEKLQALREKMRQLGLTVNTVDNTLREHIDLGSKYREALKQFDPAKEDSGKVVDRLVKGIDRAATSAIDDVVTDIQQAASRMRTENRDEMNRLLDRARTTTLAAGASVSIAIIFVLILFINNMPKPFRNVARELGEVSHTVSEASGEVSIASQSLAEGASEQAASLEETSSSLEEMSSMTKRNAENANKAKELAKQTRHAADTGASDMTAMNTAMAAIKDASADIAKIIKTIDEIAFQTNILALNAAVEAARAGEAGMGFAVVAEEVRNLAQRSAQAAKETADKIEGAISKTSQGVDISAKVAKNLQEIVAKIRTMDELVAEVAAASTEQSQGIDQINVAVSQMDKVTQSNAASAEESAAAAEELNAQAEMLNSAVARLLTIVGGVAHETSSSQPAHSAAPSRAITSRAAVEVEIKPKKHDSLKTNGHAKTVTRGGTSVSIAKPPSDAVPMDEDFS